MVRIEILVGMIASGKSTYARHRASEGALVVCHDDLCRMLHAGNFVGPNACGYEPGLRDCYRAMENYLAVLALDHGRDVVIDRTHLTLESRLRWIEMGMAINTGVVAVAFPIEHPEIHSNRRFYSDPRGRSLSEWRTVAIHHAGQARREPLDWAAEGFAEIVRVGHAEGVPLG